MADKKAAIAYDTSINAMIQSLEDHANKLAIDAANYGLTEGAINRNVLAQLEEAKAVMVLNGANEEQLSVWNRLIDARRRIAANAGVLQALKDDAAALAAYYKAQNGGEDYIQGLKYAAMERDVEMRSLSMSAPLRAAFLQGKKEELALEREIIKLKVDAPTADRMRDALKDNQSNIALLESAKQADAVMTKTVERIDQTFHDGFGAMLSRGEGQFSAFATSVKRTFQVSVADEIYKMFAKPFVVKGVVSVMGAVGMPNLAGGNGADGQGMNLSSFGNSGWMSNSWGNNVAESSFGSKMGLSTEYKVDGVGTGQYTSTASGDTVSTALNVGGQVLSYASAVMDASAGKWGRAAGTAIGTYLGGPIGGQIGRMIGGAVDEYFGGGGGPKTEWYGGQNASAFPGHDGANGLRDTVRSASVDAAANAGVATFNALIARFGGSAAMKLRLAGDSDPNGDAPDTVGYAMSLNGGQLYQGAKNFGRGEGEKNLPEMVSRALLEGVKRSDFAGVSGEIIKGITTGLDAASISTDLLAQSNAALSGVADLFGLSLSPIQASFAALKSTSDSLSTSFTAAGITGDVTTESIKRYVSALDLSTTAGQDAARTALALEPAVRTYQSSISALFGVTADSLKTDFYDAIHTSTDAASAGESLATTVMDGIQSTMQGDMASRLSDITLNGIINPIMSGMLQGQTLAQIMADGTVEAAVKQLEKTAKIYEAVMKDPRIVEILGGIKKSLGGTGNTTTPGIWGSVSKDAADAAKAADDAAKKRADDAKKAAEDAAKNAEDLKKQMSDVAYARQSIGMDALSKSLLDAAKATDEAIAKARALAATESDLNQIRALGTEQTRKLIDDAAMSAYKSLDTAQGGGLQTLYDPANAKTDQATAMGGLAASLGITSDVLDTIIAQSGGLLKAGIQYWDNLSVAQQQAVIKAAESQAAVIEANQKAWDAQLAITTKIQGWIDSVTNFSKGIDSDIFGIKYNLPGADQAGMLAAKKSDLQTQFDSYQGNPGGWNSEDMQHQLDIAGQIKDVTLQRMTLESGNATKMLDFTRGIGDYLKNLRLSELSPLTNAKKMAEAQSQFADVVNVLNDSTASAAAKDLARSKLESKADAYLKTGRDYYASSDDYTAIYQQVTGTLEQMGADTGTDAERQLKVTQTLVDKASSSIKELEALKTVAGTGLSALGALLKPELTHLGEIANTLGANGGLTKVLTDLPKGISDALSPYLDAGNRPAAIAATVSGHAPSTGITKGSEFSAADIKDSVLRWYGSPAPGFEDAALRSVYDWAVNRGVKSEQIDAAFGNATGTAAAIAKAHGWPAFAAGGYHAGGMALVGEHGAEVVDFGAPAHITPADQTRNLMSRLGQRGDDGALIAELKALREEVAKLRAERRQDTGIAIDATVRSNADAADAVVRAVAATAQSRQSRAGTPA